MDARDLPTNNVFAPQMFTLSVFCPSPYFKSYDDFGKDLASISPMMGFPLMISQEKGFVASLSLIHILPQVQERKVRRMRHDY